MPMPSKRNALKTEPDTKRHLRRTLLLSSFSFVSQYVWFKHVVVVLPCGALLIHPRAQNGNGYNGNTL
ncbi:hypothetical protein BC936DRAFT_148550 [Jimgerdemannia flammicorona]|uniref:Uncharacterized protein n=1 Tax=Jimgerdemannia flammicorona TaxID=994334 RepID=A0A433D300_9FUNG|nr:hypothetical protein BC936DRAFT_148550 [Jimgerdemannia flammicorona]